MCGRYDLSDVREIPRRFQLALPFAELEPRYNVAPTQTMPVVVAHSPNHLELMQWGCVPSWSKNGQGIINARAETVAEKAAFKQALRLQRCLVPACGFFEWKRTDQGKIPYRIRLKDAALFAFAGLFSVWTNAAGEKIPTYAIITTRPNALMAPIHNRMPVILREEGEAAWLNPGETEPEGLLSLLAPYPAEDMDVYPVSRLVNLPRNDGPEVSLPR